MHVLSRKKKSREENVAEVAKKLPLNRKSRELNVAKLDNQNVAGI